MAAISLFLHKTNSGANIFNSMLDLRNDLHVNNLTDDVTVFIQGKDDAGADSILWNDTSLAPFSGIRTGSLTYKPDPATTGIPRIDPAGFSTFDVASSTGGGTLNVLFEGLISQSTSGNFAIFACSPGDGLGSINLKVKNCLLVLKDTSGNGETGIAFDSGNGGTTDIQIIHNTLLITASAKLDTFRPMDASAQPLPTTSKFKNNTVLFHEDRGAGNFVMDLKNGVGGRVSEQNRFFNYGTRTLSVISGGTGDQVVADPATTSPMITADDEAVSVMTLRDFRYTGSTPAVYIDVSGLTDVPAIDIDGKSRPIGPFSDIGCAEFGVANTNPCLAFSNISLDQFNEIVTEYRAEDADTEVNNITTFEVSIDGGAFVTPDPGNGGDGTGPLNFVPSPGGFFKINFNAETQAGMGIGFTGTVQTRLQSTDAGSGLSNIITSSVFNVTIPVSPRIISGQRFSKEDNLRGQPTFIKTQKVVFTGGKFIPIFDLVKAVSVNVDGIVNLKTELDNEFVPVKILAGRPLRINLNEIDEAGTDAGLGLVVHG